MSDSIRIWSKQMTCATFGTGCARTRHPWKRSNSYYEGSVVVWWLLLGLGWQQDVPAQLRWR